MERPLLKNVFFSLNKYVLDSADLVGYRWNEKRQIGFLQGLVETWDPFVTGNYPFSYPID